MSHHLDNSPRALVSSVTLCALVLAGVPTPAVAQDAGGEPTTAGAAVECATYVPPEHRRDSNRLALLGVACFEAGDFGAALEHYRAAHAISGAPFLLGAMGRALQEMGYPDLARHYYRAYLDAAPTGSEGRQRIQQRLEVVEQRLVDESVAVTIASAPPRGQVYLVLDGEHWEDVGESPVTLELTPGTHEIAVEKPEHITGRRTVSVEAGEEPKRVEVEVVPESATFHSDSRTFRRVGAYTMFASIPFLAAGATLIFLGIDETDDAENYGTFESPDTPDVAQKRMEALERADGYEKWGFIASGAGAAVLITGGVLYLIGATTEPSADPQVEAAGLRPFVGPREAGVSFTW